MKNTEYKDVFDFGEEALSMDNKFYNINIPTYKDILEKEETVRGLSNVTPLVVEKIYNQTADDIKNKYYPNANA
ncbi:MAG: hypothetical protein WCJ72_15790 [Chryseobacterium sp.]